MQLGKSLSFHIACRLIDDGRELSVLVHYFFDRQQMETRGEDRRLNHGMPGTVEPEEIAHIPVGCYLTLHLRAVVSLVDLSDFERVPSNTVDESLRIAVQLVTGGGGLGNRPIAARAISSTSSVTCRMPWRVRRKLWKVVDVRNGRKRMLVVGQSTRGPMAET